jgi:tetratricopeptide (TPR) repeat protein
VTAPATSANRWLFGPAPDLLLGCGGLYLLLFLAFCGIGQDARLTQPRVLAPLLLLLFSMPHYAATLLRVYEDRRDRQRYAIFAVYTTLAILLLFVSGLYSHGLGVLLVTVYITWSPWHYTGQNYGLALMFLGRRGVSLDGGVKRWIYASFVLSFGVTLLVMHQAYASASDNSVSYLSQAAGVEAAGPIRFQPLGIPPAWTAVAVPVVGLAYLVALAVSALRLLRRAAPRDLLAPGLLATTQALWFSVPWACRYFGISLGVDPLEPAHRTYYFLWIAVGHSVQYLWVSTYYARSSERWNGYANYLGKTLLAGTALWTLPLVVFAPWSLGRLSYDGGLFLVLSAAINIHHFVLDGAIWKLRDSRVARTLLRGARAEVPAPGSPPKRWLRRSVWVTSAVGFALALVFNLQQIRYGQNFSSGRYEGAARNLDLLHWFGTDSAEKRLHLGRQLARSGRAEEAMGQLERSLALAPSSGALGELGRLYESQGEWVQAAERYEDALLLAPGQAGLLYRSGVAWLRLDQPERARERLEQVLALQPKHRPARQSLVEAERKIAEQPPSP